MSEASIVSRSSWRALTFMLLLVSALVCQGRAHAQSWPLSRGYPALWQVIGIDKTGEPSFPYGREDIAGDGLSTFDGDEQETDLRSVYADAQADRLWLRAYVAAENQPSATVHAFFFFDVDGREGTGGEARGDDLPLALGSDPTRGGYERVLAVRGDGTVLDAWQWDNATSKWLLIEARTPQAVRAESGRAPDPLRIGALNRGYLQVDVAHAFSGITASCGSNVFVRLKQEGTPSRTLADDAPESYGCRAPNDVYGDPAVLRPVGCARDAECPAGGTCREGICLFDYDCSANAECRAGETCTANRCVRVVDSSCDDAADCGELVCDNARCEACTESGARACAGGLVCAPNGACLDPEYFEPTVPVEDGVQGGAFTCAASHTPTGSQQGALALLSFSLVLTWRLRRRADRKADEKKTGRSA